MDKVKDKKNVALAVLLAAALASNAYLLRRADLAIVESAPAVELTGEAKASLVTAMTQAAASGPIVCERGVISDLPDRVYCKDGGTAGFLIPIEMDPLLMIGSDKAVFVLNTAGAVYVVRTEAE